jgi:mono/diheme cytochrome c family protein
MTRRSGITIPLVCSLFAPVALAQQPPPPQPPTQKQGAERRQSPAAAKALEQYAFTCQPCHGPEGKGVLPGTDFTSGKWKHGSTIEAIAKTISEGVPGTAMVPAKDRFSKAEILELAKLVQSFDKTRPRKPPVKK